jgi:hypothetical protein
MPNQPRRAGFRRVGTVKGHVLWAALIAAVLGLVVGAVLWTVPNGLGVGVGRWIGHQLGRPAPRPTIPPSPSPVPTLTGVLYGRINPAVNPTNVQSTICTRGYTATVRPPESVTKTVRRQMAAAAGVDPTTVVLDHLVPLEGGGAPGSLTDRRNFLLQPKSVSYVKDRLENVMHADVCSGRVPLRTAQAAMATDWQHYKQEVGDE